MTPATAPRRNGAIDEDGVATLAFPMVLAVTLVSVITLIDITGYLVAAARAQQAADAAALAAVSVQVEALLGDPVGAALEVTHAARARLERCDCGGDQVDVEVSVAVPGLVVPKVAGAGRATASAAATLADVAVSPRPDGVGGNGRREAGHPRRYDGPLAQP